MAEPTSPLLAIQNAEQASRRRLEQARRRTDAEIAAARKEATATVDEASRSGQIEAEALYQQGLQQALCEADAIVAEARKESEALSSSSEGELDRVAQEIVKIVLATEMGSA